jgi:hypothetical protein
MRLRSVRILRAGCTKGRIDGVELPRARTGCRGSANLEQGMRTHPRAVTIHLRIRLRDDWQHPMSEAGFSTVAFYGDPSGAKRPH